MEDSGIRSRQLWRLNRGYAHTFVLIKVLTALQKSLRVMGNFRERKKTQTTKVNIFPLKKIFDGK